jgi:hypothetical protein
MARLPSSRSVYQFASGGKHMTRLSLARGSYVIRSVALAGLLCAGMVAESSRTTADDTLPVASPGSVVFGRSYSQWAAAWWQWALSAPVSVNPVLDTTGAACGVGQAGPVWFVAGLFGSGSVTRRCKVAAESWILIPVLNIGYFAFLDDPPNTRTETFLRKQVKCIEGAMDLHASIDGRAVADVDRFLERSALFDVQLPADNIFGLTPDVASQLLLSPSVDEGFYLLVKPLAPGRHELNFGGTSPCGATIDASYELTVARGTE